MASKHCREISSEGHCGVRRERTGPVRFLGVPPLAPQPCSPVPSLRLRVWEFGQAPAAASVTICDLALGHSGTDDLQGPFQDTCGLEPSFGIILRSRDPSPGRRVRTEEPL